MRMLNRNALESLKENSLIVNNVIDRMSEHSAAQADNRFVRTLFSDLFLFAQGETFIPILLSADS